MALASLGGAHTSLSPEEIEKKLNIYHKGAKIWKMLIFCQVGPSPHFLPGGEASVAGRALRAVLPPPSAPRPDHSLLQGGPGHLYLLKNKVATFAKVEKEEDMIQ